MTSRAPSRRRTLATPELDGRIRDAESRTVVVWRGQRIPLQQLRERIAGLDSRAARDAAYATYVDALETLNPLYAERLRAWQAAGDVVELAAREGVDPAAFAVDLERFGFHLETPYYAALRRYLALLDIEQGDGTEADLWHAVRGASWSQWFGDRQAATAVAATGRSGGDAGVDGWRAAEAAMRGTEGTEGEAVVGAAYATLVGAPAWLESELGMATDEVAAFVDFTAFATLVRIRRDHAELLYELRLYATDDEALQRAYFSGMIGHLTGVTVSDGGYLAGIERPFGSVRRLRIELLGAMLAESLEGRYGPRWWSEPEARTATDRLAAMSSTEDVLAELGYDGLDWRPVLRQIRTRLIGEMSGYGGPNITTRAGTRKV